MIEYLSIAVDKEAGPEIKSRLINSALLNCLAPRPGEELLEFIGEVNVSFEEKDKRPDGLLHLKLILPQCTEEMLVANAIVWMRVCSQTIREHFRIKAKKLACDVAIMILNRLALSPEKVKQEVAVKFFFDLMNAVTQQSFQEEWSSMGLKLLCALMSTCRSYCSKYKGEIQDFLMKSLEELQCDEYEPLATCFSHLPFASSNTANYVAAWQDVTQRLTTFLVEMGHRLGKFIANEVDVSLNIDRDALKSLAKDSQCYYTTVRCITHMFSYSEGEVQVPVGLFLLQVEKFLTHIPKERENVHVVYFEKNVLPNLQVSSLILLESLTSKFHRYLATAAMPLGDMMHKLLRFVSDYMETNALYSKRICQKLRYHIYCVLRVWIQTMRPFLSEEWLAAVVKSIQTDVVPAYSNTDARMMNNMVQLAVPSTGTEACVAALKVLQSIVTNSSSLESPFISKIGSYIQRIFKVLDGQLAPPYDQAGCRMELYRALQCIVFSRRIPYDIICQAFLTFENGRDDPDIEISSFCIAASLGCGAIASSASLVSVPEMNQHRNDTVRDDVDNRMDIFQSKVSIASMFQDMTKCEEDYPNDSVVTNGVGASSEIMDQNFARDRQHNVRGKRDSDELDYDYEQFDEEEDEEEDYDEEEEADPPYNKHNNRTRKRSRDEYEYEEDVDEEADEEDVSDEEDEADEEEELSKEVTPKKLNHAHHPKQNVDDVPDSSLHIDERLDRDDLTCDTEKHSQASPASDCSKNDSMPVLVINENGVNSSASDENEEAEFEMPAAKKMKRDHDDVEIEDCNEVTVTSTAVCRELIAAVQKNENMDVTEMLADFVNCSPDLQEQSTNQE